MVSEINKSIPVIIPSLEPDNRLLELLKSLNLIGIENILLVNDGSSKAYDDIFAKAREQYHCKVFVHCVNMGKGRALKNAFNYCIVQNPDIIGCVTADSDGQHTASDILKCMEALYQKRDKLILGCRDFLSDNVPKKSMYGNLITRKICKWICSVDVSDTQTGLRAIPVAFMKKLLFCQGERFEFETQMLIEARDEFAIEEVKIETVYDSKESHATHFRPLVDSFKIYKIFLATFIVFILSSFSSSIVDLTLFSYLCQLMRTNVLHYVGIATVIARIISALFNYLVNYKIVFKSTKEHVHSSAKYVVLAIAQMACSAIFVTVGVKIIPFLPEVLVKMIVDTVLFFFSYYIQRRFIF